VAFIAFIPDDRNCFSIQQVTISQVPTFAEKPVSSNLIYQKAQNPVSAIGLAFKIQVMGILGMGMFF
jgi:hypothetical protein